jgi:hypothetical protein
MNKTILFALLLFCTTFIFAQSAVWVCASQAGGYSDDEGRSIATDSSGNSYVTGYFAGTASFGNITFISSGDFDVFVAKLDSSGNWLWAQKAGSISGDCGYGIAIDSSGNIYVTGIFSYNASFGSTTLTSSGWYDIFVAKLDSDGNWLWAKTAGGTGNDYCYSIVIDSTGNSYVTGYFRGTASFGDTTLTSSGEDNIFVAKLDSDGNWLWAKQASGDLSQSIAIDSSGNSYVTGYFAGTASFGNITLTSNTYPYKYDIFVAKLDSNGNWLWARQAGGADYDKSRSIAIDSSGNSYVTGCFRGNAAFGNIYLTSNGNNDIFVAKLDSSGNWLWAKKVGANSDDCGYSIAVDSSGNSYVTGYFQGTVSFGSTTLNSSGYNDIFIAKLDSNGNWLEANKAGGTDGDYCLGIAINSSGNSYITGCFSGTASFGTTNLTSSGISDIFVAKAYIPNDSNDIAVVEGTTGLGAIYPNPFNPVANITYNLSEISYADFYIYNVKGQLVHHINVGLQHPGYYQISWNGKDTNDKSCSSGIYYFIMKAGKQTFQRKAVLMK